MPHRNFSFFIFSFSFIYNMTKAEIQLIRSLDDKRGRAETGLFVAEGEKLVREILASGFRVRKVYYTERPTTPSGYACHPSFQKEGKATHYFFLR